MCVPHVLYMYHMNVTYGTQNFTYVTECHTQNITYIILCVVFFFKVFMDCFKRLLIEKYAAPVMHEHKKFQNIVSGLMCKLCQNLNLMFSGNTSLSRILKIVI